MDQLLARNKNIKLILNYVVGPLVFFILLYSIYRQVQRQPDWKNSLTHLVRAFTGADVWKLTGVLLLMFVNWGLEARKWQVSLLFVERLSFLRAFKAIFSGTTMAFFTPNRIGEYLGRMLYIKEGGRIQSVAVTIVCSIAQLLITIFAGLAGLLYIKKVVMLHPSGERAVFWIATLFYVLLASGFALALLYFRFSWLLRLIEKIPGIGKYIRYIKVLESFNATILLRILSLSLIRYLVFIAQYYLLFQIFEVQISWWQSFWSMSVVFLILAVVPSIAVLSELGIRWKASTELIQLFSYNTVGILATSLAIWIINLVIPALVGSLLILGLKIFKNSDRVIIKTNSSDQH